MTLNENIAFIEEYKHCLPVRELKTFSILNNI